VDGVFAPRPTARDKRQLFRAFREEFSDCALPRGVDMAQKSGVTTSTLVRDLQLFANAVPEVRSAWSALRDAQKDLFLAAARRGKDYYMFARWLEKQFRPLIEQMEGLVTAARLHVEGREAEDNGEGFPDVVEIDIDDRLVAGWRKPVVNALERLTERYRIVLIPDTFRGRTRGKHLEGTSLLRNYDNLFERARVFCRKHPYPVGRPGRMQTLTLLAAFPDVLHDDLVYLEDRKPAQFAITVLARRESLSPHTIRRHVIEARKATGRARPKSRIRRHT